MDMREHHLCYREVVRKYWDITKGQERNYIDAIQRWERIFLEEGAEGLMKEKWVRCNTELIHKQVDI